MNKHKFSPAPWTLRHEFHIFSKDRLVAGCGGHSSNVNSDKVIAENIANAKLIMRAPDMLECLEDVEDYFSADYFDEDSETAKMVKRIRKVIKKATK